MPYIPPTFVTPGLLEQAASPAAAGAVGRFGLPAIGVGGALRAAPYAAAGLAGSSLIDRFNPGGQNSNLEQTLQGAAAGAGIGAGIGSVVPGLGTLVGGAAGGLFGGAAGLVGNVLGGQQKKKADAKAQNDYADSYDNFQTLLGQYGNSQLNNQLQAQLAFQSQLIDNSKASDREKVQAKSQLLDQLTQTLGAYVGSTQGVSTAMSPKDQLYVQQAIADYIEPIAASTEAAGRAKADILNQAAAGITTPEGRVLSALGTSAGSDATTLANAYRAQAQLIPAMYQLQQLKSYQTPGYGQYANTGSQTGTDPSMDALLSQLGSGTSSAGSR